MKSFSVFVCVLLVCGCMGRGSGDVVMVKDESVGSGDGSSVNSNNEVSYVNVFVGSEEDIESGPCCSGGVESESGEVGGFIFEEEDVEESDGFEFRGEGDCVGRCREDMLACAAKFRSELSEEWDYPGGDIDSCRLYSCGVWGMAYFVRGWFSTEQGSDRELVRRVEWGKKGGYFYDRQPWNQYHDWGGDIMMSYPGGHICHRPSSSSGSDGGWRYTDSPCVDMSISSLGRSEYRFSLQVSRTNSLNDRVGDESTLFSSVFSCDNVVDWVLPVSRWSNDNYSGCEFNEWGEMTCSTSDLERGYDNCVDGIDNDGDGLVDCEDSNCSDDIFNSACDY